MTDLIGGYGHGYGGDSGVGAIAAASLLVNNRDRNDNQDHLAELIQSNQMSQGHQNISDRVSSAAAEGIRETAGVGRDVADGIRDAITAANQLGNINLQSTERNGGDTRSTIAAQAGGIKDSISFNANQAQRDATTIVGEICDVRKEMSDGFGEVKLEMCKQHADIQLEASRNHAASLLEMSKQHCDIKLEAAKNAADIALQLCKCCAEQEKEHGVTRALISSQALDAAQSKVGELQNEVNLQRILAGQGKGNS